EDRGGDHAGVPAQDAFGQQGGGVLPVDTDPVPAAPGEVEVPGLVDVSEVAGPVPAVVDALGVGGVVLVVALEAGGALGVDDLPAGLLGVAHPAVLVEARGRAGLAGLGADDPHPVARGPAECGGRPVGYALEHAGALAGAVALHEAAAEAAQERGLVLGGRLG